jgi:hypothetical protein
VATQGRIHLDEGLHYRSQILFTNPDAVVPDAKAKRAVLVNRDVQRDLAARRREFHCIGQKVEEDSLDHPNVRSQQR